MFSAKASVVFATTLLVSLIPASVGLSASPNNEPTYTGHSRALVSGRYAVFNQQEVSYLEALVTCELLGLRLATINSAEDDKALQLAIAQSGQNRGPWWVGATDLITPRQFLWTSKRVPVWFPLGYTNWAEGQPSGDPERCMEVGWPNGTLWNDYVCENKRHFICEENN